MTPSSPGMSHHTWFENYKVGFPDAGESVKFQQVLTPQLLIVPSGISVPECKHFLKRHVTTRRRGGLMSRYDGWW